MSVCGLDFGTSNTTLGTIARREPVLTAREAGQTTIPSAIFYEVDGAVLIPVVRHNDRELLRIAERS